MQCLWTCWLFQAEAGHSGGNIKSYFRRRRNSLTQIQFCHGRSSMNSQESLAARISLNLYGSSSVETLQAAGGCAWRWCKLPAYSSDFPGWTVSLVRSQSLWIWPTCRFLNSTAVSRMKQCSINNEWVNSLILVSRGHLKLVSSLSVLRHSNPLSCLLNSNSSAGNQFIWWS